MLTSPGERLHRQHTQHQAGNCWSCCNTSELWLPRRGGGSSTLSAWPSSGLGGVLCSLQQQELRAGPIPHLIIRVFVSKKSQLRERHQGALGVHAGSHKAESQKLGFHSSAQLISGSYRHVIFPCPVISGTHVSDIFYSSFTCLYKLGDEGAQSLLKSFERGICVENRHYSDLCSHDLY